MPDGTDRRWRLGVDIGGTFTDIVLLSPRGELSTRKLASTTADYADGILQGLAELIQAAGIGPDCITGIAHGTTVATNAILEGRGARTALVTTAGFRDVLEMRRLRIPVLYDLQYRPPVPLVPRRLRLEVAERIGPRGEVWRPLDERSVEQAADRIASSGVEAVAVALLNAYANPAHERRVGEILADRLGPTVHVTLASDILPEIREYERTSTTVVNAYIAPVVTRYLAAFDRRLKQRGVTAPLRIMQSNGGVMAAAAAALKPAYIIESGPAAGVIGAVSVARRAGITDAISLDMGGTTAKAALIEDGQPARTTEYEVGAGINLSSRLVKGGGHAVKLPFLDVSEIGAGGGSIVGVDALGSLKVGPRSAGAAPGPACYGLGGTEATFTDAMVVLGYLNPLGIAGGRVALQPELAHEAIRAQVADRLGVSVQDAAWGAYAVASASMTRAVKAVSTYRGRDPRRCTLIAFGGNGPLAAVEIARALHMKRVLVPPAPGVFSAFGLLCSDTEYVASRSLFRRTDELGTEDVRAALASLEAEVRADFARDGLEAGMTLRHSAELRYAGQAYELAVPIDAQRPDLAATVAAFDAEHARTYGHSSPGAPIDLVCLRVAGRVGASVDAGVLARLAAADGAIASRSAYFGPRLGLLEADVLTRSALGPAPRPGPLIIEEYDATCIVPPDCTAARDPDGNIDIRIGTGHAEPT